jgi:hypothetical protein
MEQRRLELGLTWEQVAQAGGIGYETIRAARNETSGIRKLTRAAIDRGLRWEQGSVDRVLAGQGDAVPLPDAAPAADGRGTQDARYLSALPELPDSGDVADDVIEMLVRGSDVLAKVWALPLPRAERLNLVRGYLRRDEARPAGRRGHSGPGA